MLATSICTASAASLCLRTEPEPKSLNREEERNEENDIMLQWRLEYIKCLKKSESNAKQRFFVIQRPDTPELATENNSIAKHTVMVCRASQLNFITSTRRASNRFTNAQRNWTADRRFEYRGTLLKQLLLFPVHICMRAMCSNGKNWKKFRMDWWMMREEDNNTQTHNMPWCVVA